MRRWKAVLAAALLAVVFAPPAQAASRAWPPSDAEHFVRSGDSIDQLDAPWHAVATEYGNW